MPPPRDPRTLLVTVARALGDVRDRVVFVGGCAPAAFELSPTVSELRPTVDVDCVVDANYAAYTELVQHLMRTKGLRSVARSGVPICRYELGGVEIDLMPIDPSVFGFSNCWYADVVARAAVVEIDPGLSVRVITPLYFVATKLEAFADRGETDARIDPDLEDIISVLRGVDGLIEEIGVGTESVHSYVRARLSRLAERRDADEVFGAHFEPDPPTQALVPAFLAAIRSACVSASDDDAAST